MSFLSLLQNFLSLEELLFRLRCTTTNLSIFLALFWLYQGSRNSNCRRNNSNRNALRNTWRVSTS